LSTKGTDKLVLLINSLTRSEKRSFKLHSSKVGDANKLYVKLFDEISKTGTLDEQRVLKKIDKLKKSQLANVKANLYQNVLRALRDLNTENDAEIKIRELYDFSKILYDKGQYRESLDVLKKARKLAKRIHSGPLEFMTLNFEKHIELHHVTGSMTPKAIELHSETQRNVEQIELANNLSNLSLRLYGMYLQNGFVKNESDIAALDSFFSAHMPNIEGSSSLGFYQQLYYNQCFVWYHYMMKNFVQYYKFSKRWVELFESEVEMINSQMVLYYKGLHNVLAALFLCDKKDMFSAHLLKLRQLVETGGLSINEKSQLHLFISLHELNGIFLHNAYKEEESLQSVEKIEEIIEHDIYPWDTNRVVMFRYKIACVYFGAGEFGKCLEHLNAIINSSLGDLKQDVQCFARILSLITHYELSNEMLLPYQVKSVYRFLLKMKELEDVQKEILQFIRGISSVKRQQLPEAFITLKERLLPLENHPIKGRPFLYLDIISWLDSKIYHISMVEAIERRNKSE